MQQEHPFSPAAPPQQDAAGGVRESPDSAQLADFSSSDMKPAECMTIPAFTVCQEPPPTILLGGECKLSPPNDGDSSPKMSVDNELSLDDDFSTNPPPRPRAHQSVAGRRQNSDHFKDSQAVFPRKRGPDNTHEEHEPSILTAVASGVINYLLMFGLCCAYGMIMFTDEWNQQHRALGVKMTLSTSLILGLLLAVRSKLCVAIGGPDLTPVVFLANQMDTIAKQIAEEQGLTYPESTGAHRRLWSGRHLAGGGGSGSGTEFCTGSHLVQYPGECASYRDELVATSIFAVMVSSLLFGIILYGLGRSHLTRLVSYVPTGIMEAFLSCIGYKVFKYALDFCMFDPKQFIPAACVGVPLYFLKSMHWGNPAIFIPLMLFVPLGAFYFFIMVIQGKTLEDARQDDLMFPQMDNVEFWKVFTLSYGMVDQINLKAWIYTLPDLAMMIVVCLLDCLLKLSSTESKLPVTVDKDYEVTQYGISNFLCTICGATVGYMQLKFNVINYGVLGNSKDRRGGAIYAVLCGVCFFGTIEHFNYLPRFFLGTLLFFAGAGFVAENLWGSRKYLSYYEWIQIFIIVAVFIFTGALLYAVLAGGLLTGLDFIIRYSRVPCTSGAPVLGGEIMSKERHSLILQRNLQHIANSWLLVIKLKGFVFFASAQKLTSYVKEVLEGMEQVPKYRRLRYVAFDCQLLDGMDASASKAMMQLGKLAVKMDIRILWSHVNEKLEAELMARHMIADPRDIFKHVDELKLYVDEKAFQYRTELQQRWVQLHPAFQLWHDMMRVRAAFEPFEQVFQVDAVRRGCPWKYCGALPMKAGETVLWEPGERNQDLFLVHSGAVGIYKENPETDDWDQENPVAIYRHGWFLNREVVIRAPTRFWAVAIQDGEVLFWNERQWSRMSRERPFMASAIYRMVMRQQVLDADLTLMTNPFHDLPDFEEEEQTEKENRMTRTSVASYGAMSRGSPAEHMLRRRTNTSGFERSVSQESNLSHTYSQTLHTQDVPEKSDRDASTSTAAHREATGTTSAFTRDSRRRSTRQSVIRRAGDLAKQMRGLMHERDDTVAKLPTGPGQSQTASGLHSSLFHTVIPWLLHDRASTLKPSEFRDRRAATTLTIPEELMLRLEGIYTAQVLSNTRLFDAVDCSTCTVPQLPKSFRDDLEIAFHTYGRIDTAHGNELRLPWRDLSEALMFAGIFNTVLQPLDLAREGTLSLHDFLAIGHKAVMAPLSELQETKLREMFEKYDLDKNGRLNRDELVIMFRQLFHPDISIEEVDGIAWSINDDELSQDGRQASISHFLAIMSSLVRNHEPDWILLRGFKELFGKEQIDANDKLHVETLMKNCRSTGFLDRAEAEELLWAADWRLDGIGEGQELTFVDLLGAVVLDINLPTGSKLPPRARTPEDVREPPKPEPVERPQSRESASNDGFQRSLSDGPGPNVVHHATLELPHMRRPGEAKVQPKVHKTPIFGLGSTKLVLDVRDESIPLDRLCAWLKASFRTPSQSNLQVMNTTHSSARAIITRHDSVVGFSESSPPTTTVSLREATVLLHDWNAWHQLRVQLYYLLEEPSSSRAANYLSYFMGAMIIICVLTLVLEPLLTDTDGDHIHEHNTEWEETVWRILEIFFTVLFTVELLLRFCVIDAVGTQTIKGFIRNPSNICDFVAILPYYVEVMFDGIHDEFKLMRMARLMRLSRVMRIAKLAKRRSIFGPVAMILTVIWGIYIKTEEDAL